MAEKPQCWEIDPLAIPGIRETIADLHRRLMEPYVSIPSVAERRAFGLILLQNAIHALSQELLDRHP